MTTTKADARKVAAALMKPAKLVLAAKTVAKMERERVDKIKREILAAQVFTYRDDDGRQLRVTEPKYDWQMGEHDAQKYYALLEARHARDGYKLEPGHCPALVAEHEQTKAEWLLIEAAAEFFPGVTNDKLLCGTSKMNGLDCRRKFIDLLLGLCATAPNTRDYMRDPAQV